MGEGEPPRPAGRLIGRPKGASKGAAGGPGGPPPSGRAPTPGGRPPSARRPAVSRPDGAPPRAGGPDGRARPDPTRSGPPRRPSARMNAPQGARREPQGARVAGTQGAERPASQTTRPRGEVPGPGRAGARPPGGRLPARDTRASDSPSGRLPAREATAADPPSGRLPAREDGAGGPPSEPATRGGASVRPASARLGAAPAESPPRSDQPEERAPRRAYFGPGSPSAPSPSPEEPAEEPPTLATFLRARPQLAIGLVLGLIVAVAIVSNPPPWWVTTKGEAIRLGQSRGQAVVVFKYTRHEVSEPAVARAESLLDDVSVPYVLLEHDVTGVRALDEVERPTLSVFEPVDGGRLVARHDPLVVAEDELEQSLRQATPQDQPFRLGRGLAAVLLLAGLGALSFFVGAPEVRRSNIWTGASPAPISSRGSADPRRLPCETCGGPQPVGLTGRCTRCGALLERQPEPSPWAWHLQRSGVLVLGVVGLLLLLGGGLLISGMVGGAIASVGALILGLAVRLHLF